MDRRLANDSGLTIIEVLISAVVFMIGFSLLVALLNTTLLKFSTKELTLANNLGEEVMALSLTTHDTTTLDSTIVRSGIAFKITRDVMLDQHLAEVSVIVRRAKSNKELLELYNEFLLPEQQ